MKLENLLQDMRQPCVLDIKMGRKTYDPFASKEKIAMETAKFPPAKNLGYQISGMLVRYGRLPLYTQDVIIILSFFTKVLTGFIFFATIFMYRLFCKVTPSERMFVITCIC